LLPVEPPPASSSETKASTSTDTSSAARDALGSSGSSTKPPADNLFPLSDFDELAPLPLLEDLNLPEPATSSDARRVDSVPAPVAKGPESKPAAVTAHDLELPALDDDLQDLLPSREI
jgi:hypothetical protein